MKVSISKIATIIIPALSWRAPRRALGRQSLRKASAISAQCSVLFLPNWCVWLEDVAPHYSTTTRILMQIASTLDSSDAFCTCRMLQYNFSHTQLGAFSARVWRMCFYWALESMLYSIWSDFRPVHLVMISNSGGTHRFLPSNHFLESEISSV